MHHAIRERGAVNLLVVELILEEIKEVEVGYKTTSGGKGISAQNASNGDYADTKDTGKKTTKPVNQSLAAKLIDKFSGE